MRTSNLLPTATAAAIFAFGLQAACFADDGLRDVRAERYGVVVRVPQAWRLINWSDDDQAFLLKVPQDDGSEVGYVSCDLALAPESLEEYRKRYATTDAREQQQEHPQRTLIENRIEPLDAAIYGAELAEQIGQSLVSSWEHRPKIGPIWYELRAHLIAGDVLYTFTLATDEAHYEAYRLDFQDMLASTRLNPPDSGLTRLAAGYWMQSEFRFAMQLPEGWRPSFSLQDNVLFFATGATHEVFTDNLLVLASPPLPQDFEALRRQLPADILKIDPQAEVSSQIVLQGAVQALETVVRTQQGPFEIVIFERRFGSEKRNYEVRFTCEAAEYEKIKDELRRSLDSFIEVAEESNDAA